MWLHQDLDWDKIVLHSLGSAGHLPLEQSTECALSPNLTGARGGVVCGAPGLGGDSTSLWLVILMQSGYPSEGSAAAQAGASITSNNRSVACRITCLACFKQVKFK